MEELVKCYDYHQVLNTLARGPNIFEDKPSCVDESATHEIKYWVWYNFERVPEFICAFHQVQVEVNSSGHLIWVIDLYFYKTIDACKEDLKTLDYECFEQLEERFLLQKEVSDLIHLNL